MSRRDPNRKLNFQRTQIRSILSDFRKAKYKCLKLYEELKIEMPDKVRFDSVEKQTTLKMELLDLPGLVALKSTLLKTLTQLFELQSQISTKKQGITVRKQFGSAFPNKNLVNSQPITHANKNLSLHETEKQKKKHFNVFQDDAGDTIKRDYHNQSVQKTMPSYEVTDGSNQEKIDRIANFLKILERSMKDQSTQKSQEQRLRDILLQQPEYCKIKEQLQRYKMREQEIEYMIEEKIKQRIKEYCEDMEIIEETQNYKIVKIYKTDEEIEESENSHHNLSNPSRLHDRSLHSMIDPQPKKPFYQLKKQASVDMTALMKQTEEKDKDIVAIQEELSKDKYNVEDVVSKISSTLQNSQMRLKQLREQRKKIFMDEDIWEQFENI